MALLESMIKADKPQRKENMGFGVTMVHYSKLIPSEDNNYSIENIEELANVILLSGGIKQNLLARKRAPDEYELIAGHRRRLAVKYLVEDLGYEEYAMVPVHVEKTDDMMSEINLMLTNCTARERSDWEKMMEVTRLTELMKMLQCGSKADKERFQKVFGQSPDMNGREMRKVVAEKLGLSETKVAQLRNIERNLEPDLKERFKKGDIGVSVANAAASLPVKEQEKLIEKKELRIADVKKESVSESDTGKCLHRSEFPCTLSVKDKNNVGNGQDCPHSCCWNCVKHGDCKLECYASAKRPAEENDVPVFTLESNTDNAYVWTWQEVVKSYLAEVHKVRMEQKDAGLPEVTFKSFGYEYHTLIKDSQVVFLMEGEIQFIVDGERIKREYDWDYMEKNEEECRNNSSESKTIVGDAENEADVTDKPLSDLELLKDILKRQNRLLDQFLQSGVDENDEHIRKQKLLVAAIASMVCDMDEIETKKQLEENSWQSELPKFKNNDQRKEWLRNYRDWGLWYEDKNIGARYYKYDFDNGARLIAEEYEERTPVGQGYTLSFLHLVGGPEPPKHPAYGFGKWNRNEKYNRYPNSETELVEFLKVVQKEK